MAIRTGIGALITALYLGGTVLVSVGRWQELKALPLNALGDMLAGVFAPLAFLWLVLGYRQQGEELRLQAAELKASVEAQRQLAEVAAKDHKLQVERLSRELEELERGARPHFIFKHEHTGHNGKSPQWTTVLSNAGASATHVEFTVVDAPGITVSATHVNALARGDGYPLRFFGPHQPGHRGHLRIDYIDSRNQARFGFWKISETADHRLELEFDPSRV